MITNTTQVNTRSRLLFVTALSVILLLSGCGESKKPATQVAAKVDKDELTIGQVNSVFAKIQVIPGKTATQVKHEVLDNLIDQQLAMRQAISKKLDRDPAVMLAIEEAKRNILASAYMDKIRASVAKVTTEEASKYYAAHPELFAQRRIFNLRELDIAAQPGLVDNLRGQLNKGLTLEAIASDLKSKSIPFSGNASTHAAEETPFEILSKISVLKDGQMTLIEGKNALTILQVVASQSAPVDEKTATPSILQYLSNNKTKEEIVKELSSLKKIAKIEYFGEFLPGAEASAEAVPPVADTPIKVAELSHTPDLAKAVSKLK
jgi:EpsD family peptidyl-prolyl cis-trans isomerase